jgi:NAD(P)-dependent dehydrogenase (short-subunit alcohol dehydrogenase family)
MYAVPPQHGKLVVVTGSNSGTGKEAARRLAGAGARVIMAVRSPEKGEVARADILGEHPGAQIEVRRLDLAELASVREFADGLLAEEDGLDLLLNNAGVMTPPTRHVTVDGFELQFGTNFLGPFLLTNLLLPTLLRNKISRVVTMTSMAAIAGRIDFDDLNSERSYSRLAAYSQSKLADHMLGKHLALLAEQRGWGLLSTLAHPGYTRTNLLMNGPNLGTSRSGKSWYYHLFPSMGVQQGTEPLLHAATDLAAPQGGFYGPRFLLAGSSHPARAPRAARRADSERLWSVACELTGLEADVNMPRHI